MLSRGIATVLALLGLTALAACDTSSPAGPVVPDARLTAEMKAVLIDQAFPDFGIQASSDRALGTEAAAQATSANVDRLRKQLDQTSFEGGFERVFTNSNKEYITVLVFDFQDPTDAYTLVQFQVAELRGAGGNVVAADPALSGAFAYDLAGTTRAGGKAVFCGGEWFAYSHFAFDVDYCGYDHYTSSNLARLLARNQRDKAGLALGLITPSPSPPPVTEIPIPPKTPGKP